MIKLFGILTEGVYDPGIFKAVFTAGGPGSGKSYTASTLFGMPEKIPTVSFSIAESEIRLIGTKSMQGDYASWNYFQSIKDENNQEFVENFQKKYGSHRVVADPMEAGYVGVYLYAKAVESVGSTDIIEVREALKGMTFHAPEGVVGIDPENNHLSKIIRIGQILPDGQFKIVSSSEQAIKAQPYPDYKTKEQWNTFLENLYNGWGKSWANPGI